MQTIILAGGKGERLKPLTLTIPKPLISVGGKPILERILETLPNSVDEVIIVVGYLGERIKEYFRGSWNGKVIKYVEQKEQKGTFNALECAEPLLNGEFLLLMGDVINSKKDLENLLKHPFSVLVRKENVPSEKLGVVLVNEDMRVSDILERQKDVKFTFANCGAYKLNREIFKENIVYGLTGEEWLSSMVGSLSKKHTMKAVEADFHFTPNTIEDIKKF